MSRDRELRNRLVLAHRRLAGGCAGGFVKRGVVPQADLEQVALLGLVKAVERFDPEYGTPFTAFAVPTIRGELRRYFRDATWPVHVPRRAQELYLRLAGARERLAQALGRAPTTVELAADMGVDIDDVLCAIEAANAYRSSGVEADHAGRDDPFSNADARAMLDQALRGLPPRERRIVHLRFVEDRTQQDIAREMGMSQVHISRLLRKVLDQLHGLLDDDNEDGEDPPDALSSPSEGGSVRAGRSSATATSERRRSAHT